MSPRLQSFFIDVSALVFVGVAIFFLARANFSYAPAVSQPPVATSSAGGGAGTQTASADAGLTKPTPRASTSTTPAKAPAKPKQAAKTVVKAAETPAKPEVPQIKQQADNEAIRIQDPYSVPPQSFDVVNVAARAALVNILCMPRGGSSLSPITGSGVIIDPRGVILTNAHVAQYVLLSQSPQINLSCVIRTGAPATARYSAEILYIPPVWVTEHVGEIRASRPLGTGEHDYALLLITRSLDTLPVQGDPLLAAPPGGFPFLPVDTREGIGFQDDRMLVASYPAEFLGGFAARNELYPASSITTIRQLMTFTTKTIDLLSLGGVIEAQSGSSGGAVVNAWGRLIGLISTTSEGDTTDARDLRAVTLSYINRDLAAQTQFDLATTLGGDVVAEALDFYTRIAPNLVGLYIEQLVK